MRGIKEIEWLVEFPQERPFLWIMIFLDPGSGESEFSAAQRNFVAAMK
jgi:hypothetical protein